MKKRVVLLAISTLIGVVGCTSLSGPSIRFTKPSTFPGAQLCASYQAFLTGPLSIADADVESLTFEEGGIVGWETLCTARHSGRNLIGALQVDHSRTDEPLDIPDDTPVDGFQGRAWVGSPLPDWTEVTVHDGTWQAQMRFVKDSPEQQLLGHDEVQHVAEFLGRVARDVQG